MPSKYRLIPDSPFTLAQNLSLSLAADSQLQVLKGRMTMLLDRYQGMRGKLLAEARYFNLDEHRSRILSNCPPLYYAKSQSAANRTCRRYSFCPFCWARLMAGDGYLRFERLLFGDNRRTRKDSPRRREQSNGFDLFEYSEELLLPIEDIPTIVWQEHDQLTQHKQWFRRAAGTFYLTTLEPHGGLIRIRPRLLSVIPRTVHDRQLPPEIDGTVVRHRWRSPDRTMVAQAVGRTCEYPLGLLKGPLSISLDILEARSGRRGRLPRLSTYHGDLRGSLT